MNNFKKTIKIAEKKDLPLLLKWGKEMYTFEKKFMPLLRYSESEASKRYNKEIQNPNFLFLIAELDEKPVGYLYAHIDKLPYLETNKPQCEIEVIFLEKKVRGLGLSQKLITDAIAWAKNKGAFEIKAGIFAQNTASIVAFEKSGLKLVHTTYTKSL